MRHRGHAAAMPLLWALTVSAGLAHAETPASALTAPSAPPTMQQQFNTASNAEQAGDCKTALPLFEALASDPRVKPGSLPAAAIAVRRGHCLFTFGRDDEGEAQVEAGLPVMRQAGANFAGDVAGAELELGNLAALRHDENLAIAHYQAALVLTTGDERVVPLLRLAAVTAFDGDDRPLGHADEALKIAMAAPHPDKKVLAYIHDVHGRILLNQGQVKAGYTELKQALDLSGGLTDRVHLEDVQLRGDLAQAALLNGDREGARNYLAYTGAGHIAESPFAIAVSMKAPDCGSETGLKPEDTAIVDFAIGADGGVTGAQTVYTRGTYAVAAAFAKAVNTWFWRPEDLAKVPAFYRQLTRVEMRCSNSGGNVPRIPTPLSRRYAAWARTVLMTLPTELPTAALALQALKDQGDAAVARGDFRAGAAALGLRAIVDPRAGRAQVAAFDEPLALGQKAGIPQEAMNALRVLHMARQVIVTVRERDRRERLADWDRLLPMADQAPLVSDPLAADTLRLLAVPSRPDGNERSAAIALALRVADDGGLPAHAPLRQEALLWLANDAARAGQLDVAQGYFQRTGLDSEQCALIGPMPAMRWSGVSSSDYPMEAWRMGFEGWVKLEYNINADGTTAAARALISYPPFVFEDAATGMARNIRYERSYRPGGGAACNAEQQSIKFAIPSRH